MTVQNPLLNVFEGGQMTDLPPYPGGVDLTALFEIVSPGNAKDGINYSITVQQFLSELLPAFVDFFNTSETLTTGASPVTINPLVYLTKIISGGTGGMEIVIFPARDATKAGIPHAIEFLTQTNPSDVVQLYGHTGNSNPIQGSPMGPLGPLTGSTLLALRAVSDASVMTWGSNGAWIINGLVGSPTATFPNANAPGVPIVYGRNVAGAYGDYHDVTNPAFAVSITSSTNSGAPTSDTAVAYATGIISTGSAGDEFIALASPPAPGSLFGDAGIRHVIYYKTQTDPSDFVDLNVANIRNSDGTTFTSVQFLAPNDFMLFEWHPQDSTWRIIDGTSGSTNPAIVFPSAGSADYFSTFESLTTGASPVTIDPTVFLTKITSGGTAGTEIVIFDDYIADQAGKPHLIVLETRTNVADVIQLYGDSGNSNPILVSAFGSLADKTAGAVIPNTTMTMTAVGQGFVLTWGDLAWELVEKVQEPTITYSNAGISLVGQSAPTIMVQNVGNGFEFDLNPVNPSVDFDLMSSTSIGSPAFDPVVTYATGIVSTGSGATEYIELQSPPTSHNLIGDGIYHLVWFKTRTNGSDQISINLSNVENSNGSPISSITFSAPNDYVLFRFNSLKWQTVDDSAGFGGTVCIPAAIPFNPQQLVFVHTGATFTLDFGYSGLNIGNSGAVNFTLPALNHESLFTFTCLDAAGITATAATGQKIQIGPSVTATSGNITTTTVGASVTLQDCGSGLPWIAKAVVGNWTVN